MWSMTNLSIEIDGSEGSIATFFSRHSCPRLANLHPYDINERTFQVETSFCYQHLRSLVEPYESLGGG